MPPDLIPVDYDPFSDAANAFPSFQPAAPASDLPQPLFNDFPVNQGFKPFNKLFGTGGETRHVLWPEQMVRRGLDVVHGASQGENQLESAIGVPGAQPAGSQDATYEPNMLGRALGMTEPWRAPSSESGIAKVQDLSGLMAGGPLIERPGAATLGSGMTKPATWERPTKIARSEIPDYAADNYFEQRFNSGEMPVEIKMSPKDLRATQPYVNKKFDPTENPDDLSPFKDFSFGTPIGVRTPDGLVHLVDGHNRADAALAKNKPLYVQVYDSPRLFSDSEAGTGISGLAASKAPPFYSAVEAAVRDASQPSMSPEQWRGYLSNRPGVKAEELDWVGLPEGKKVTKQEMLDHVQEHGVQVKEVEKRGIADMDEETASDVAYRELMRDDPPGPNESHESWLRRNTDRLDDRKWELLESEGQGGPKFGPDSAPNLSLPGGENYREKLFTLPDASSYKAVHSKLEAKYGPQFWEKATPEELKALENPQAGYQSSHWDEPNVLAHVRMNDRVIPDATIDPRFKEIGDRIERGGIGAITPEERALYNELDARGGNKGLKTLHLEELQSDWHQAGRKQGYKIGPDKRSAVEISRDIDALHPRIKAWEQETGKDAFRDGWPADIKAEYDALQAEHAKVQGTVPDAPFKTTWPDLVLKRMIRDAAEGGYDAISWTPGEAQAARYDLSRQVDGIQAVRRKDGSYNLIAKNKGDKDHTTPIADRVPEAKLADYVGKDLAEKIADQVIDTKEYSGLDLKVGGEGMKGFYDKILVDKANALAKKFGGKVEYKNVPVHESGAHSADFRLFNDDVPIGYFSSEAIAMHYAKQQGFEPTARVEKPAPMKVPVLRLTPQMKDTALRKGFPLFSAGVPFPLEPVDHDPFKEDK